MAQKCLTVNEVVEGLHKSDFEDSDDEFDGYLDMDDEEMGEKRMEEVGESMGVDEEMVGANEEVGGNDSETEDLESVPEYTGEAGCSVPVERESAIKFIDSHELGPDSRVRQWSKETHDVNELRRFLAIIILMGLIRYPQMESHWAPQCAAHLIGQICTIEIAGLEEAIQMWSGQFPKGEFGEAPLKTNLKYFFFMQSGDT